MLGLYTGMPIGSPGGSGGFRPSDIPGIVIWAEANVGVVLSGSNVTQWNDQSGNGNHLTQATPANQPQFVASGINGKPSISFNGTTQFMIADGVASVFNGTDRPYTALSVFQKTNTVGNDTLFGVGSSVSGTPFIRHSVNNLLTDDRSTSSIRDDLAVNTTVNSNIYTRGNPHFVTHVCNGTTLQYYTDGGIDLLQPFDVGTLTVNRFSVGALRRRDADPIQDYFDGLFAAIIIYDRLLNSSELNVLHNYISA